VSDPPVPVRPAATVILVRDGADGLETLLVRRNAELVFHGGSWVFPGGRVDDADADTAAVEGDEERAARAAAVREALEEADLLVDPASLVPFAHWTTPPGLPRRFATWFFLAAAPVGGTVATDGGEITDHRWFRPADALEAQRVKEIDLPPPTFVTLHRLLASATVDDALLDARDAPYVRFEPRQRRLDDGVVSLYPGDAAYDDPVRFDDPTPRHRLWVLADGWRYECS
jgi:8-oxo-dGTP pyrophosphatase MutT (NUDIX family)